jgi:hypothetical protein
MILATTAGQTVVSTHVYISVVYVAFFFAFSDSILSAGPNYYKRWFHLLQPGSKG